MKLIEHSTNDNRTFVLLEGNSQVDSDAMVKKMAEDKPDFSTLHTLCDARGVLLFLYEKVTTPPLNG